MTCNLQRIILAGYSSGPVSYNSIFLHKSEMTKIITIKQNKTKQIMPDNLKHKIIEEKEIINQ